MSDGKERYALWCIDGDEARRCELIKMLYTDLGLSVVLSLSSGMNIEMLFELKDIVGFKFANDSYTWRSDSECGRVKDRCLFKVENSKYVDWFKSETYGCGDLTGVIHFCFMAVEERIDVVSFNEPSVTKSGISG